MVEARWEEDQASRLWRLECRGHAGFQDEGPDLVCAAVSALTGALGIGFTKVLNIPCQVTACDGHFFVCLAREQVDHPQFSSAQVLLRSVVLALEELACHYPGFIQVHAGNNLAHE
jgi:uncharacterized protein YsxB (DUF464 family)